MAARELRDLTVLLPDPELPDPTKRLGVFAEEDVETFARMERALESLGKYRLSYLKTHDTLLADLQSEPPQLVMNLCDTGFRNVPTQELHIAALLELLGIPYTGAPPAAMVVCFDKGLVSAASAALGVPVADERYFPDSAAATQAADTLVLPALIKPVQGDGSIGINRGALVRTPAEARTQFAWLEETLPGRALLVQEFLPGQELSLGLLGNPEDGIEPLPLLEADFSALPTDCVPILCYESKAEPTSPYWSGVQYREAKLEPAARQRLLDDAQRLFVRLGLRDYARFDFRTDAAGAIKLMEVNPNPAWSYDGKFAMMCGLAGRTYAEALDGLIQAAWRRVQREQS